MTTFSKLRVLYPDVPAVTTGMLGVLDIGSSTMALTIYDVAQSQGGRYEVVDKIKLDTAAGSVRKSEGDFYLGPDMQMVLDNAADQVATMIDQHQLQQVVATATSVFRDAQDGPAWCETQAKKRGWLINLIDGDTEAKLSAMGALSSIDCGRGLVVDQGGGSLEIYDIASGRCASFPFGVHSLMGMSGASPLRAAQLVESTLRDGLPWLMSTGGDLVMVGRAWRMMGSSMLLGEETSGKSVSRDEVLALAEEVLSGRMSDALAKLHSGYEVRLPYRAAVATALLQLTKLERVRFADYALREGIFLTQTR